MDNIMLEKMRRQFRNGSFCDSAQIHKLLFSIRLKEYCAYLEKLSTETKIFQENYQDFYEELLHYYYEITPSRIRRTEVPDDSPEATLTVGKMLQKAADMCCHYDDYTRDDIKQIGDYITDMLMVRPFVMLGKR